MHTKEHDEQIAVEILELWVRRMRGGAIIKGWAKTWGAKWGAKAPE